MKKFVITILSLAAFLGGFLIFYQSRPVGQNTPAVNQTDQQTNNSQKWETKTDEQLPVTVKATPIELGANTQTWKFQIVFDTHSGSLDDDLLQIAVLADDAGREYRPIAWEGAGPGGHHREGVLIFNAISPTPPVAELKIRSVGGVPERSFSWSIK